MHQLGPIVAIQCQPDRIKSKGVGYFPDRIRQVTEAALVGGGLLGRHDGTWIVDVHHPLHPGGRGTEHRAVSFGFTSHYAAMGDRFGAVARFAAGENLIVDTTETITPAMAVAGFLIRTGAGDVATGPGHVLAPCREFTSHLLGLDAPAERDDIAADMAFLADGMRGFGTAVPGGPHFVRPGDEVWVL
jgi:hypothetical protein